MATLYWLLLHGISKYIDSENDTKQNQITLTPNSVETETAGCSVNTTEMSTISDCKKYCHNASRQRAVSSTPFASDSLLDSQEKHTLHGRAKSANIKENSIMLVRTLQALATPSTRDLLCAEQFNQERSQPVGFGGRIHATMASPVEENLQGVIIMQTLQLTNIFSVSQKYEECKKQSEVLKNRDIKHLGIISVIEKEIQSLKCSIADQATQFQLDIESLKEAKDTELRLSEAAVAEALQHLSEISRKILLLAAENSRVELEQAEASHSCELASMKARYEAEISVLKGRIEANINEKKEPPTEVDKAAYEAARVCRIYALEQRPQNPFMVNAERIDITQLKQNIHPIGEYITFEPPPSNTLPLERCTQSSCGPKINDGEWKELKLEEQEAFDSIDWDDEDYTDFTPKAMPESTPDGEKLGSEEPNSGEDLTKNNTPKLSLLVENNDGGEGLGSVEESHLNPMTRVEHEDETDFAKGGTAEATIGMEMIGKDIKSEPPALNNNGSVTSLIDPSFGRGIFNHQMEIAYFRLIFRTGGHALDQGPKHCDYYRKKAVRNRIVNDLPLGYGWAFNDWTGDWDQIPTTVYRPAGTMGVKGSHRVNVPSKLSHCSD